MANTVFNGNDKKYDAPDTFVIYNDMRRLMSDLGNIDDAKINDIDKLFYNAYKNGLTYYPKFTKCSDSMIPSYGLKPYEDIYIINLFLDFKKSINLPTINKIVEKARTTPLKIIFKEGQPKEASIKYNEFINLCRNMRVNPNNMYTLIKYASDNALNPTINYEDLPSGIDPYEYIYIIVILLRYVTVINEEDKEKILVYCKGEINVIELVNHMFKLTRESNTNAANKAVANKAAANKAAANKAAANKAVANKAAANKAVANKAAANKAVANKAVANKAAANKAAANKAVANKAAANKAVANKAAANKAVANKAVANKAAANAQRNTNDNENENNYPQRNATSNTIGARWNAEEAVRESFGGSRKRKKHRRKTRRLKMHRRKTHSHISF
jgi:hypothetical protein